MSCSHTAPQPRPNRVTVNGVEIPRHEIAAETQNFPAFLPGEAWQQAAQALAIRTLLLQEATRLGLAAEPETDAEGRRETEEDALLRALVECQVTVPAVDDETLRRYYGNNKHRFTTAPLYEAAHILIAARRDDAEAFAAALTRAEEIAARLATDPSQFAALARDCSACPSAALGGSLGQIGPGDTTTEFEAALRSLAPGEISAPVATRYGVHIIRLARRIDGRLLPFEAVRDRIADYLDTRVRRHAAAQYLSLLIGRARIDGIELAGAASPLVQ